MRFPRENIRNGRNTTLRGPEMVTSSQGRSEWVGPPLMVSARSSIFDLTGYKGYFSLGFEGEGDAVMGTKKPIGEALKHLK
jgi:hypothetical protein